MLKLNTLNPVDDFTEYLFTFVGEEFDFDLLGMNRYLFIINKCFEVTKDEVQEEDEEDDFFEQLKRKKMAGQNETNSNNNLMGNIVRMCIGDLNQQYSTILSMNLCEMTSFSKEASDVFGSTKKKEESTSIEDYC